MIEDIAVFCSLIEHHAAGDPNVASYLRDLYKGVFDKEALELHAEVYVGARFAFEVFTFLPDRASGTLRILDVGSGFGSFVTLCTLAGHSAVGVEMSAFETSYARSRLSALAPGIEAERVFVNGDVQSLMNFNGGYDVISLWNVAEHIEDLTSLLKKLADQLRDDGQILLICPNYFSWRKEPHYGIRWNPLMVISKTLAARRIEKSGKNSEYFLTSVFPKTVWGVRKAARGAGLKAQNLYRASEGGGNRAIFRRLKRSNLRVLYPFGSTVSFRLMRK